MSPASRRGPVAVRPAEAGDLPALVRLETLCFLDPWPAPALAAELAVGASVPLVAVPGRGEPAGYAFFRLGPGEAELLRLAVHPDHRRRGLASALLAAGLARLEAAGSGSCFLEVRAANDAALGFYRAAGFSSVGRRRSYYADGDDALLLALALPRPTS